MKPSREVFEDRQHRGEWRVESIERDGTIDVVLFSGLRAEALAREYFNWKGQQQRRRAVRRSSLRLVR